MLIARMITDVKVLPTYTTLENILSDQIRMELRTGIPPGYSLVTSHIFTHHTQDNICRYLGIILHVDFYRP